MIIFDELEYAEGIIKNGYKNKKYIGLDNIILVKYWKYKGLKEDEIRSQLKSIMVDFQNLFNGDILEYKINKAMCNGMKYDLLTNISVDITKDEINLIGSLETIELQKMMFVLLVVWKFRGQQPRFRISNADLMKLSEVRVHNDTFWNYINKLIQSNLLTMVVYKSRDYYKINIDSGDNTLFSINKFDNLIYYYLKLLYPDDYKECEECGKIIKITSNRAKYCKECWKEKERELRVDINKKYYEKNKFKTV